MVRITRIGLLEHVGCSDEYVNYRLYFAYRFSLRKLEGLGDIPNDCCSELKNPGLWYTGGLGMIPCLGIAKKDQGCQET